MADDEDDDLMIEEKAAGRAAGAGSGTSATVQIDDSNFTTVYTGLSQQDKSQMLYCNEERHKSAFDPDGSTSKLERWRMKERMKTVSVALVLCLNIGVDPPDIIKTVPCARLECWIDPFSLPPQKGLDQIGSALQQQYERWQQRAKYKQCLDPTNDEVKKLCQSLRRNAKEDRVLFHYNGHGVPRPTPNGEIWVFNKNYTQYIPLSVYDLQAWMGHPSIYVFDCSAAGLIVNAFQQFDEKAPAPADGAAAGPAGQPGINKDVILLAACGADEILPMNPDMPADVFTACLTTPIKMALRWFCSHSVLTDVHPDLIDKIPGKLQDRRTPLGELNWIFTGITDTIAWNVLPRDLFQKLFRQDLLVASLFRNYLLAERILRSHSCTPISFPRLPATYNHPMWQAWDLAADICVSQLPHLLSDPNAEFKYSPFFAEQLTAFEVWLDMGSHKKTSPEQLPIVLQVLLSQVHRLRALELLGRFLDLGPWAVNLALSVGIFPYVLKLLQSPATDLRQILVFIWAKIFALDDSCQGDLVKDNAYMYFINVLAAPGVSGQQRAMATFVLTAMVRNFRPGQSVCLNASLISICTQALTHMSDPLVRRWLCLCVAKLWEGFEEARRFGLVASTPERLMMLLKDPVPEVRAAAVCALTTFFGGDRSDARIQAEAVIAFGLLQVAPDASPVVRRELVIALSRFVIAHQAKFEEVAAQYLETERAAASKGKGAGKKPAAAPDRSKLRLEEGSTSSAPIAITPATPNPNAALPPVYATVWKILLGLSLDPFWPVAGLAATVLNSVTGLLSAERKIVAPGGGAASTSAGAAADSTPRRSRAGATTESSEQEAATSSSTSAARPVPHLEELKSTFYEWCCSNAKFQRPANSSQSAAATANLASPTIASIPTGLRGEASPRVPSALSPVAHSAAAAGFPVESLEDPQAHQQAAERAWRKQRNERLMRDAASAQAKAGTSRLDEQIAILDNETEMALLLLFDPFEPYLMVADEKDLISVWNYEEGAKLNSFSNENKSDSRVTSMTLINELDVARLLVATDEGVVRIWKDLYEGPATMVTAWRALAELQPGGRGSGLIVDWQQPVGRLVTSGDVAVLRVWDLEKETVVCDIPTNSTTCVTSLSSDRSTCNTLFAGCGDGTVRLFDLRAPPRESMVGAWSEHKEWVVNVHAQQGGNREVVSGSLQGDINIWDARTGGVVGRMVAHQSGMTALAVHDYAPILASGSHNQYIKVCNLNGDTLSMIRYHDGFLGQRIGPVSCLAFHPHLPLLAAGSTDSIISIYAGGQQRAR